MPIIFYAWRSWRSAKAIALVAVVALAMGIGCATAIFTVANAVLLKPLPYSFPDRWVTFFGGSTLSSDADRINGLSLNELTKYQEGARSFDVLGWYFLPTDFNLTAPGEPEHVNGVEVTSSLIDNAGIRPILGNLFHDSDGPQVALISARLWRRLGHDRGIVRRPITVNGKLYTVMGVMPDWFQLPLVSVSSTDPHNDLWIPVYPGHDKGARTIGLYVAYARLKPGVTLTQARADAERVAREIVKEDAGRENTYTVKLFSLKDFVGREIRPVLLLFFGAAGLLLVVTCANVAGLLVAKSVSRAHEVAIRVALGVRRSQLALQFFFEGCFLSVAAAVIGVLASIVLTHGLVSLAAEYIPRSDEISINGPVLVLAAILAFLTALLPSLAPLWQALRTSPMEALSSGVRASADARSRWFSRALVTAEVALAFLLVTVGGLLVSEVQTLRHTWPGFNPDHLVSFQLNASGATFPSNGEFLAYQSRLLSSLEAIPGVSGAALANQLPLAGCCLYTTILPEGRIPNPNFSQQVSYMIVSPGYFNTMRIPLDRGRLLTENDTSENPVPIVIDEATAQRYWPNSDPLGAYARFAGDEKSRLQVVGVVGDVRNQGLGQETRPEIYLLNTHTPVGQMQFVVRSQLPAARIVPSIREAMQRADRSHPIYAVQSMDEIVQESMVSQRFASIVVAFFALAALLMASLGVYSVTSYSVRERTVEIGTRMALGAVRGDVLRLVLGSALRLAGYGIPLGAAAALGATWLVIRFVYLHHVSASSYAYSAVIIGSVTTLASGFPAWRATFLTPMAAMRNKSDPLWSRRFLSLENQSRDPSQEPASPVTALFTGFVDASRRAASFTEALTIAMVELCDGLRSERALLFEQVETPGGEFALRAASPDGTTSRAIPSGGFLLNRLKFHTGPLAFVAGDLDTALRWANENRPHYVAEIEQLKQLGTALAVPLRTRRETIGLLLLTTPLERKTYTAADKLLLQACAQELALMIENARLTARIVEQEKIRRDVALAAEVQEKLLDRHSMETGSASVAAYSLPARSVGGDCYDFLDLGKDGAGIALADVSGKGIAAALIMAVVQSSLRIIASEGRLAPRDLAAKMNHFLYRSTGSNSYATFFYAQLPSGSGQLRYVNAGHNPPYLLRLSHSDAPDTVKFHIEELRTGGPVIGMLPGARYEEATVDLRSGNVVLAFTDGVTEALNPREVEFGEERLKNLLGQLAHLPVQQIVASISRELRNWIAEAPQHDDLTFIVLKMN